MKVYNPDFKSRVEKYLQRQEFMKHIGFNLDVIEAGRTEGKLTLEKKHLQQKGYAHGGLVATLADITAGFAAYTLVPDDHNVVTGEIKVSYFQPGIGQELHVKGWVIKPGRKINFCEAEVWCTNHDRKTLIAKATASMVTIFPEDTKR
ncbi:MAG: PaaI family thioesterase [Cytophagales bacterium]|nr:PaaI family thioesterase [Cytophagales bacterium]